MFREVRLPLLASRRFLRDSFRLIVISYSQMLSTFLAKHASFVMKCMSFFVKCVVLDFLKLVFLHPQGRERSRFDEKVLYISRVLKQFL